MSRRLSSAEKAGLYEQLRQGLAGGVGYRRVLATLRQHSRRGAARKLIDALEAAAGEAFEVFPKNADISRLEQSLLRAGARAGRSEDALEHLVEYYDAKARLRRQIVSRTTYPVFLLHLGIVILALPVLVTGGWRAFAVDAGVMLLLVYAAAILAALGSRLLLRHARVSRAAAGLLKRLPLAGAAWWARCLHRFVMALRLQIASGVPMLEALRLAGAASGSAAIERAGRVAAQRLRDGEALHEAFAASRVLPHEFLAQVHSAEESGQIVHALRRIENLYRTRFESRVEALAEWGPRLLYLAILCYLAYRIISMFQSIFSGYEQLM